MHPPTGGPPADPDGVPFEDPTADPADIDPADIDPVDADLLAELGRLLGPVDDPPPEALAAARAVFTWRTVDAELAALTYDSLLDLDAAEARSASVVTRTLTFESGSVIVELEIEEGAGRRRLLGQLVPPRRARVEVRGPGRTVTVDADEMGRFTVVLGTTAGPVALTCRTEDGTVVETAAVRI